MMNDETDQQTARQDKETKGDRLSLYPLTMDEALRKAMHVEPQQQDKKKRDKDRKAKSD